MFRSVFSVGLGTFLTLLQILVLKYNLDPAGFNDYRYIINTMMNLAPLLCLGIDNSYPKIFKKYDLKNNFSHLLNLYLILFIFSYLCAFLYFNFSDSYLLFSFSASFSIVISILISNHIRMCKGSDEYFFKLNIKDKFLRFFIVIISFLLIDDFIIWAISLPILLIINQLFIEKKYFHFNKINFNQIKVIIHNSLPFMFSSIVLIILTRSLYYYSYFYKSDDIIMSVDMTLLMLLFYMIPNLNLMKICDTNNQICLNSFCKEYLNNYNKKSLIEFSFVILFTCFCVLFKFFDFGFLLLSEQSITILLLGFCVINSIPNYFHLLLLKKKLYYCFIFTLISVFNIFLLFYLIENFYLAFLMSCLFYFLLGFFVFKFIFKIEIGFYFKFWNFLILCFSSFTLLIYYYLTNLCVSC